MCICIWSSVRRYTFLGKLATRKAHNNFVRLAAFQIDINTAQLLYEKTNITIMHDQSQKNHKNLLTMRAVIPNDNNNKPIIRTLGMNRLVNKKTKTSFEKFQELVNYFDQIKQKYLKDPTTETMINLITSTLTDHANDVVSWCNILKRK